MPASSKADIYSFVDQVKLYVKALIESHLLGMQSTMITKLWVRWKKPGKSAITLDPEDKLSGQDVGGNAGDNYINVDMPFNSLMTEVFEDINIKDLIQNFFMQINM